MDFKKWVTDEPLISEKAKEYFAEVNTERRRRKAFFQERFDGVVLNAE